MRSKFCSLEFGVEAFQTSVLRPQLFSQTPTLRQGKYISNIIITYIYLCGFAEYIY